MTCSLTVFSVIACVLAAKPAGVDLASLDGWDIVVAPDAIAAEIYAAEEFRDHLAVAGGPRLSIVDKAHGDSHHVFVGPGHVLHHGPLALDAVDFGPEDLRIVVRDGNIAISGGRPRGTLYGVYTFLEDYLGVRFLTADHTHVPPLGSWRHIGAVDRIYRPPLQWRWADFEPNYQHAKFAAKLRLNGDSVSTPRTDQVKAFPTGSKDWSLVGKYGGRSATQLVLHTFQELLPPQSFAEEHPEYYMLYEGELWAHKRYEDGRFREDMQPCLAQPDVRRIITENALSRLAKHHDWLNVPVSQNDGSVYCQCTACAAIDQREGTPMGSVLTLVNSVADAVATEFPGRMVGTLAYAYTDMPPKHLRPRSNVQIVYCQNQCFIHALDDASCSRNTDQYNKLRSWSQLTDNLHVWSYYFNHDRQGFQLPLPNLQWIGHDIRVKTALGVKGMFMQAQSSSHGNEFQDLRNYLLSRIMWDPNQDLHKLMSEWLDLYYGPAAPPIERWLIHLHDRSTASGLHRHCLGGRYDEYGLGSADVQVGLDAVAEAMDLADSEVTRQRVEQAMIWAYRAALEPVWYVTPDKHVEPDLVQTMRPIAKRFFELCNKYDVRRTASGGHLTVDKIERRLKDHFGGW
ncbi:MAG: DUF4838 domain-containing protein [Pirellulaceae bacterium]|nr:DUF4838 domain-containing protein [Pirellulaceae bacterium]